MSPEDIQNIVSSINNSIQEDKSKKGGQEATQFSLDQMKSYFQKKYLNESEDEIMIRTLDHMKSQFLKTFPSCKEDTMSTSSQGSMDILAGESQSPTPEDFWDSLI
ncbi:hypothetical protein A2U01_0048456, partial [Trifolium medium]|nr:hypothetical protein [Trifolium medium]